MEAKSFRNNRHYMKIYFATGNSGIPVSDGENKVFMGGAEGEIVEPRGDRGFGYDPLFLPDGKNETSHRQEALLELKAFLG